MANENSTIVCQPSQINERIFIGAEFGIRTVIGVPFYVRHGRQRVSIVVCECKCGKVSTSRVTELLRGGGNSCGCQRNKFPRTHYASFDPLMPTYKGMLARCYRKSHCAYHNYGERGITVCDEWRSNFHAFKAWAISSGWQSGLEIDRRNNNGNYSPENCRCVTRKVNQRNRRNNVMVPAFDEAKTTGEWAEDHRCVVFLNTLKNRISTLGWDVESAIITPVRQKRVKP